VNSEGPMLTQQVAPQWIAKMYAGKTGRDHLGLGSVSSDQILPSLSPSINVLTFHPRYHSFYVFLLDEFWRREIPKNRFNWIRFFRPREFIFSIGAYLCDQPEHGEMGNIVGGQKTGPLASQELPSYNSRTEYIQSELGGYGLYYRTVMAELGLIYPSGPGLPHPVDVPSEYGKKVAEAYREAVKDTPYYQKYFDQDAVDVPIEAIREYIHHACLCQLEVKDAPDRTYLLDTFLHRGRAGEPDARRATFRMFLDLADQTQSCALTEDHFRQLIYFQKTTDGIIYTPRATVQEIYLRWRLYQAREYYAFALNALWYYLCEWGLRQGGDVQPIRIQRFWDHLAENLAFERLTHRAGLPPVSLKAGSGFRDLMQWLESVVVQKQMDYLEPYDIDSPLSEHNLYRMTYIDPSSPEVMVTGMIVMLALIGLRLSDPGLRLRPEWEVSRMGSNGRLSVDRFLKDLEHWMKSGPITILEIAQWIYRRYIIQQHQAVATSKLPDNTFRFQRQGDRLQFHKLPNSLNFMNSRFDSISTTIHELGLCGDLSLPGHHLTEDGNRLLEIGDL
jgi:hypothetical protein